MIHRSNTDWYTREEALSRLSDARDRGLDILTINGAYITDRYTKPNNKHSMDFYRYTMSEEKELRHDAAITFLEIQPDGVFFDLVFDTD